MIDPGRVVAATHEAASALTRATRWLLAGTRPAITVDDGTVTIDPRTLSQLTAALRQSKAGASRAEGLLTERRSPGGGATLPVGVAWALVRHLNTAEREDQRARQIERGLIPGALSSREALQVMRGFGR